LPANEFSIGSDWVIDLLDPITGGVQSFSLLTGFSKQQNTTEIRSNALDGLTRIYHVPETWSGTCTYDRATRAIDDYFVAREDVYFSGRVQQPCTITETIREVDGSTSQYRYTGVSFTLSNGGNAQAKDRVEMSIDWIASRRVRVF
jgi:hypothetical protein